MSADECKGEGKGELVVSAAAAEYHICEYCGIRPAAIFQVTGTYCVECWQELTHPNV